MANVSEMELQNLRHLLLLSETEEEKFKDFAQRAQDPAVKQYFEKSAQCAVTKRNQLLQFLN